MSKSKKETQPHWRPNFVNQSELPDIKVVRTGFIINFMAVMLALWVVFSLIQREYRTHSLRLTIEGMEQRIRVADADDRANLKLSGAFRDSAQFVVDVESFFDVPLLVHEFLYGLSQVKPDDLIFNSVSFTESVSREGRQTGVGYSLSISGDAKSLTVLDDFKVILSEAELLQIPGYSLKIDETLKGRNEQTGIFPYTMAISLKPAKSVKPATPKPAKGEDPS